MQTVSAPLVPLKHHPPNTTRSSGRAPPAPALCTVPEGGELGRGRSPRPTAAPRAPLGPPAPGKRDAPLGKTTAVPLSGFGESSVAAWSLARPPPPAPVFPPGTLSQHPPKAKLYSPRSQQRPH